MLVVFIKFNDISIVFLPAYSAYKCQKQIFIFDACFFLLAYYNTHFDYVSFVIKIHYMAIH